MTPEPLCRCGGIMRPQVVATGLEGKYRNLQARMQELAADRQDKIKYIEQLLGDTEARENRIKQMQARLDSYYEDCNRLIEKNVAMKSAINEYGESQAWMNCEALIRAISDDRQETR